MLWHIPPRIGRAATQHLQFRLCSTLQHNLDAWEGKASKELKGKDPYETLTWTTPDVSIDRCHNVVTITEPCRPRGCSLDPLPPANFTRHARRRYLAICLAQSVPPASHRSRKTTYCRAFVSSPSIPALTSRTLKTSRMRYDPRISTTSAAFLKH